MRRFWLLLLIFLSACGTEATKPAASSSSPTVHASLPPHCVLPLVEPSLSAGFLFFPDGTYTTDPLARETLDETTKNLRTGVDRVFHGPQDYSMNQPTFDARSSRWLPVARTALSPDGSRYIYSQYLYPPNASATSLPAPIGSLIRIVTIATGEDRVIYQGPPHDAVGWNQEGIYLRRPCTDTNCRSAGGLWLLNPSGGARQQIAAPPAATISGINRVPMWTALGGGAA